MNILEDLKSQIKIGDIVTKLIFWNIVFFAIPSIVFGVLTLFKVKIDYLIHRIYFGNLGLFFRMHSSILAFFIFSLIC